jgi:type IV pilus assembly protein PilC
MIPGPRVSRREVVLLTRQLATLLSAGLPLVASVRVLERQASSRPLRDLLSQIRIEVARGGVLSEALARHPRIFPPVYTGMVTAGESSGMLDGVLLRLAVLMERSEALIRKIRGATLYPAVVLGVASVSVALLLILVIPTFELMFADAGIPLPIATQWVLTLSRGLTRWWWLILLVLGAVGVGLVRAVRTPEGKARWHSVRLVIPLLGPLERKAGAARFARVLGTLLAAGVPLMEGLALTARTVGNRTLEEAILSARETVLRGGSLAQALEQSGEMPPLVTQMVQVGEQTGALDEMLSRVADLFEDEVEAALSTLVSILEPTLVVILGVVVGGMVVAMYLPVFDMVGLVG